MVMPYQSPAYKHLSICQFMDAVRVFRKESLAGRRDGNARNRDMPLAAMRMSAYRKITLYTVIQSDPVGLVR